MSFTDEFEDSLQARRFRHRSILLFVILATLPFYIVGAILLGIAPDDEANISTNPSQPPPNSSTQTLDAAIDTTATLSGTPTATLDPTLGSTLLPTPRQFRTPTRFVLPTQTQAPLPTSTTAPTFTLAPSATSQPTATATPQANQAPVFNASAPDQGLAVGETVTVNLDFSDPDGDTVNMSAVSDNTAVANITGATVMSIDITGNSVGSAVITVTLNDGNGGITEDTIAVTVSTPNSNPVFTVEPLPIVLNQGETSIVDLMFSDPDGDTVTFTAVPANTGVATATPIDGTSFNVTGVAGGNTTILVTLEDGNGGTATRTITITVNAAASNNAPEFTVEPLDIIVEQGDSEPVLLQVNDPDGDPLTLTVVLENPSLATITIIDASSFTVQGNTVGTTNATLQLQDGEGGNEQRIIELSVEAPNP